ncbi:MAG: FAD-dependent oxidoreductase [Hydrogenophaga sp.]|uniref:NAD(P)/FAD-dependent oxidoreductase n=1 Tax=Hydrogenophaga sp. TaxID=1904254 RepID=UPI00257AE184|nr:FAD-dependent oxidoreductase [Hydrogenophaga sp.]MBL0944313.1 FAD-dependent oxidoreductase [Hydrogenophaga sp.]
MKIAIVGAGVNGLATAHELLLAGHQVTVYERRATAAEEGSFAPAGLLHPAWALAWAQPQPRLQPSWSAAGPGLRWRSGARLGVWAWWRRWRHAQRARAAEAQAALIDLLAMSEERQAALTAELDLDHDRSDGLLVLARDEREFARALAAARALNELGVTARQRSADEARALEPALNPAAPLAGAIELPGPAVANCREWTLLMRQALLKAGGQFVARQAVLAVRPQAGGVELTLGDGASERHDAVVLCAGLDAPALLRGLGLPTPFATWWSHSLSAPMREPVDAPLSGVLDLHTGVAVTRLGQRLRASGGWDLGGAPGPAAKPEIARLADGLSHWFPAAARWAGSPSALQSWRGATLVAADGLPLLGESRVPGVWLNLAHGPMGWALACGAAHRLTQALTLGDPSTIVQALRPARLGL